MNLNQKREKERRKYEIIYNKEYWFNSTERYKERNYERYGHSNHGRAAFEAIALQMKPRTLCDVGTGHGEFPRMVYRCLPSTRLVAGFDFALPLDEVDHKKEQDREFYLSRASAHDLPLKAKTIDVLTSFDMMEHLLQEEVGEVLQEFTRVCRHYMVLSISYRPSGIQVNNEGLHPTVQPKQWWMEMLRKHTGGEIRDICHKKFIQVTLP